MTSREMEVCLYIRESLPVTCLFNTYFKECLILEVYISNKKGYVISPCRLTNQATDEFNLFMFILKKLLADISYRNRNRNFETPF